MFERGREQGKMKLEHKHDQQDFKLHALAPKPKLPILNFVEILFGLFSHKRTKWLEDFSSNQEICIGDATGTQKYVYTEPLNAALEAWCALQLGNK